MATDRDINIEYTLKSFGPRHALMTINKRRLISLQPLLLGVAFAAFSGSNKNTLLVPGGLNPSYTPQELAGTLWFVLADGVMLAFAISSSAALISDVGAILAGPAENFENFHSDKKASISSRFSRYSALVPISFIFSTGSSVRVRRNKR